MKLRVILYLSFLLILTKVSGQNLIVNGSFETQTNCCGYADFAPPWKLASALPAKLFTTNSAFNPYFSVPVNLDSSLGYQIPRTGDAYAGFNAYWNDTIYREYLGYPLVNELVSGKTYCLTFYVSLLNYSRYGIDGIGAYFSNDSLYCPTQFCLLNYTPQVSNPTRNIILDTLGWTEIRGCFTASGGEKYMTIGNFKPDSLTQRDTNRYVPSANWSTFYYIDDVSLYEDTTFGVQEHAAENYFSISPNPAQNTIRIQSNIGSELINLQLFNELGELVYEKRNSYSNEVITIPDIANGTYICKIFLNSGVSQHQKLVILKN